MPSLPQASGVSPIMFKLLPALIIGVVMGGAVLPRAHAQTPATSTANASSSVPELVDFDAFIEQQLKVWNAPGVSIAIVKDGKVVLSRGYGLRDVARNLPMTDRTVQPIASVTKSFTVASLATLVRDGKLEWDKPVRDYLPDFRMHSDYATQTLTVRDLVTHRSGLPRHDWVWFGSNLGREDLYKRLRHFELSAEPRARFQYNNLMYMTAGYLGGKVAGSDWETLVRKSVFEPLGMNNSSFTLKDLSASVESGQGYTLDDDDKPQPKPYEAITAMGPTGSINSNARDMAQYLLMFAGSGVYRPTTGAPVTVINAADFRAMSTGQFSIPDARVFSERTSPQYGMGLFVANYRGHSLVEHGGNMPGASTTLAFIPDKNIGVYATVNVSGSFLRDVVMYAALDRLLGLPPVDWSGRYRDIYLKGKASQKAARAQGLSPRKANTKPSYALEEYVGEYEHPGYGVMTIGRNAQGALTVGYNSFTSPLAHFHFDVFEAPRDELNYLSQTKVQFLSDMGGDVAALMVAMEPAVKPAEFKRLPDKRLKDPAFLRAFVGQYKIAVTEYNVALRPDGVLTLSGRTGAASELIGLKGRTFEIKGSNGTRVEFVPDASGAITQMAIYAANGNAVAQRAQ